MRRLAYARRRRECGVVSRVGPCGAAIKSGEDEEGRARGIPSKDITVSHVTVHGGHAVSVGSEMSGGVYNVKFTDITFDGRGNGFGVGSARIKTQRGEVFFFNHTTLYFILLVHMKRLRRHFILAQKSKGGGFILKL